jgi:hypothetical protein
MPYKYYAPCDPECPEVAEYFEMADDPIMRDSGCWGEFKDDFEAKHRAGCKRCQLYGAENIDIV